MSNALYRLLALAALLLVVAFFTFFAGSLTGHPGLITVSSWAIVLCIPVMAARLIVAVRRHRASGQHVDLNDYSGTDALLISTSTAVCLFLLFFLLFLAAFQASQGLHAPVVWSAAALSGLLYIVGRLFEKPADDAERANTED